MSKRSVALGGFMGVGKTTVGRALAERLDLPFVDADAELEARHGPVPAQVRDDEPLFRRRESAVIAELIAGPPLVLATGGGAWVDPQTRAVLGRHACRVVLQASLDTLATRVGAGEGRPLWGPEVAALLAARQPHYGDADLVVQTDGRSVADIVEEVVTWLRR